MLTLVESNVLPMSGGVCGLGRGFLGASFVK